MSLFDIGFLPFGIFDLLDILIVGYLLYWMYKLLRGSVAINIFLGVVLLIVLSYLVDLLEMQMLSTIFGALVRTGTLVLIILFQPEIRRFLFMFSNNFLENQANWLNRILFNNEPENTEEIRAEMEELHQAIINMGRRKDGALIILSRRETMENIANSGVLINANVSSALIQNIFSKNAPLHDGAMLIKDSKVWAASCILPVSDNPNLPQSIGLRHRAAVGVTERLEVFALIVSEETGTISYAQNGKLTRRISSETLKQVIRENWS